MRLTTLAAVLAAIVIAVPVHAASLWSASSVGIGAQGAWFDGADERSMSDIEATARGALSITPHVSVVGGLQYGFSESYVRSSVGVRLTATDVKDRSFSVGLGVARHFRSEEGPMDEWCGEAAIGWKPVAASDFILTSSASYGLDTSRRLFTVGVAYPLKLTFGSQ